MLRIELIVFTFISGVISLAGYLGSIFKFFDSIDMAVQPVWLLLAGSLCLLLTLIGIFLKTAPHRELLRASLCLDGTGLWPKFWDMARDIWHPHKPLALDMKHAKLWVEHRLLDDPAYVVIGKKPGMLRQPTFKELQEQETPLIPILNCQHLINHRNEIIGYLKHLAASETHRTSTLCKVEITQGFIAPIFLLSGLQAAYNEEWGPKIKSFGLHKYKDDQQLSLKADLSNDERASWVQFNEFRLFQFYCWLMWGPSIPVGPNEGQWQGNMVALQYGFGDENNSIDLLLSPNLEGELQKNIFPAQFRGDSEIALPARRTSVKGHLTLPSIHEKKLSNCQQWLLADKIGALVSPRIGLEVSDAQSIVPLFDSKQMAGLAADLGNRAIKYYSAYIWCMFAIFDSKTGQPVYAETWQDNSEAGMHDRLWRELLPFFVHGNIGDAETYEYHKQVLVASVCGALKTIMLGADKKLDRLCLRFTGSFDDTFPYQKAFFGWTAPGQSIRHLLRAAIRKDADLSALSAAGRIVIDIEPETQNSVASPASISRYYNCRLPRIIKFFLEGLKEKQATA